ncbi:hypothetical protein [Burkholderia oklahomensis]|uniref:hypothetical protein n=1 Tax=Burkholderia oklahomensis TaxID=342113 RepID=UPI0002EFAFFA|nr:hypothetical protein [Burkholderia oklahomensis]MBI0363985.1 hypothetical protein [Burkholderia oklahomensis]
MLPALRRGLARLGVPDVLEGAAYALHRDAVRCVDPHRLRADSDAHPLARRRGRCRNRHYGRFLGRARIDIGAGTGTDFADSAKTHDIASTRAPKEHSHARFMTHAEAALHRSSCVAHRASLTSSMRAAFISRQHNERRNATIARRAHSNARIKR